MIGEQIIFHVAKWLGPTNIRSIVWLNVTRENKDFLCEESFDFFMLRAVKIYLRADFF